MRPKEIRSKVGRESQAERQTARKLREGLDLVVVVVEGIFQHVVVAHAPFLVVVLELLRDEIHAAREIVFGLADVWIPAELALEDAAAAHLDRQALPGLDAIAIVPTVITILDVELEALPGQHRGFAYDAVSQDDLGLRHGLAPVHVVAEREQGVFGMSVEEIVERAPVAVETVDFVHGRAAGDQLELGMSAPQLGHQLLANELDPPWLVSRAHHGGPSEHPRLRFYEPGDQLEELLLIDLVDEVDHLHFVAVLAQVPGDLVGPQGSVQTSRADGEDT